MGTGEHAVAFTDLTPKERAFVHSLSEQSEIVGHPGRDVPEPRRSFILRKLENVTVATPSFRISGTRFTIVQPDIIRSSASYQLHAGPIVQARHQAQVVLIGLDRATTMLAAILAQAGVGQLHLVDESSVQLPDMGGPLFTISDLGLPKTSQAAKHLTRQHPKIIITGATLQDLAHHSALPEPGPQPGVAIAMGRDALDPAVRETLMMSGLSHLQVIFGDTTASIGPMVVAGIPGCLDCADLPLIEHEGDTFVLPPGELIPDAASASVVAGLAAQHILMVIDGQLLPATVGARMTFHLDTGAVVTRELPVNTRCACHRAVA